MTLSKHTALIAVMFLAPVVCCFVGIGAFVHVVLAAEQVEKREEEELRQQRLHEVRTLHQELDALRNTHSQFLEKIREVQQRIQELADTLLQANRDGENAEEIKKQIHNHNDALAHLLANLSELETQIARKQERIEALRAQIEENSPLAEEHKKLSQELKHKEGERDEAQRKHESLRKKAERLRRWREEQEKDVTILPKKKPRPGAEHPLFVECAENSVILQPQETELDASPDSEDRSQFLAAARKTGYVVFLIRPSGFHTFKEYRSLVQKQSSLTFGFEPVDASWNLVYPD